MASAAAGLAAAVHESKKGGEDDSSSAGSDILGDESDGDGDDGQVVSLEAREGHDDDEDMDLAKMRERQERLAAIAREEARCVLLQKLLVKYGVDARHPEYFSYLPSIVLQGLLVGFRYQATAGVMEAFVKAYDTSKSLVVPKSFLPSGLDICAENWNAYLGKRRYFRDLVRVFRDEGEALGESSSAALEAECALLSPGDANRLKKRSPPRHGWVIQKYLPVLLPGCAGSHFHGLIHLALALLNIDYIGGNAAIIGDALAFMAYSAVPLGPMFDDVTASIASFPGSSSVLTTQSSRELALMASTPPIGARRGVGTPATPATGAGKRGVLSPLGGSVASKAASVEEEVSVVGTLPFFDVLLSARDDRRFKALFTKHEGKTPVFKKKKWSHARSYQQRLHILQVHGTKFLDEHFRKFRLFTVDFTNAADPYFQGSAEKNIPAQLPEEALQRSCVNFVDDLLHLLNTAECASDTVLLECVKAGWALLQLMPMLGAINARHEALLHFAKACLAAYVCRGRPAFVNRAREDHIPVPPPPPVEDDSKKKRGGPSQAAASGAGAGAGAGAAAAPAAAPRKKKLSKEQEEELKRQAEAACTSLAKERAQMTEVYGRLLPLPEWSELIAAALADLRSGDADAIVTVHVATELKAIKAACPRPWPPRDDAKVAADAAAAEEKVRKKFEDAGMTPHYIPPAPEPTLDEAMRRFAHSTRVFPATHAAPR